MKVAARPRRLKRYFMADKVASWFHPRRVVATWIRRFPIIVSALCGFEQAAQI